MTNQDLQICNKALQELGIEPITDFNNEVGIILLQSPNFINHYQLSIYLMPHFGIFDDRIRTYLEEKLKGA